MNNLLNVNGWKLTALESGDFRLDGGAMMGSVPKVLWNRTNPSDELNRINLAMRCMLLDNGRQRILIETGIGLKNSAEFIQRFHIVQEEDPLAAELAKAGLKKTDITDVIITHLHFDHAGGATDMGEGMAIQPAFPNAVYHISRSNWVNALHPSPRDAASYLSENFLPLEDAGCLSLIPDNHDFGNGLSTIAVNGHTSGQQLVKVTGAEGTVVFCSDLIPLRSHLKLPWIMGYDLSARETLLEKTAFLRQAADENWWLFFYHDPDTVMVQVSQGRKHYEPAAEITRNRHHNAVNRQNQPITGMSDGSNR